MPDGPFSVRLSPRTREHLLRRARRIRTAPHSLAKRYIEEGLRQDEHPLIHFADGPGGRRASVLGGPDVWEVIATVRDNAGDPETAARYLEIAPHLVSAAVAYYGAYRDEIDARIADNEEIAREGHAAWQAGREAIRG